MATHSCTLCPRNSYDIKGYNHSLIIYILLVYYRSSDVFSVGYIINLLRQESTGHPVKVL